ncbi:MAG: DUF86 domain-containing protein [Candidatus Eisenbacteria bacterium]
MVDKPKLDQMLSSLRGYVQILKGLGAAPRDEFLANPDKIGNAKYHLVIAIECCIDIANHIIASENYRFPRDNADSFSVLLEHGVLESADEGGLRQMARFRNRLVHLYWEVDDTRVQQYLKESLGDLDRFARAVATREWG